MTTAAQMEPVPTVYLDESGFTGSDLLNRDQKVFCCASVSLVEDEARALLLRTIGELRSGAQEYSHSALAKTLDGQRRIAALLSELGMRDPDVAGYHLTHKRFALLGKLIDNWIEPAMHRDRYELYREGGAVSYLNMIWSCLPSFEGEDRFDALLRSFQEFSRRQTPAGFERFFDFVETLVTTARHESGREILAEILYGRTLGAEHLRDLGIGANDIAYPAVFRTIAHWDSRLPSPFAVVHDESKNLAPVRPMLEAVMRLGEGTERTEVGFDGTFSYYLPFRSTGLTFVDSRDRPQLQVADLLAGAATSLARYLLDRSFKPEYANLLLETGVMDSLRIGSVWPSMEDIKRRPPVSPGVEDPLEVTARLMRRLR